MATYRRRRLLAVAVTAASVTVTACAAGEPSTPMAGDPAATTTAPATAEALAAGAPARTFDVERIASGLDRPTFVGAAPGDPEALWVLEQPGRVLRLVGAEWSVVLDLGARVRTGAEQGLLGVAFHPRFATNDRLFLHWSDGEGDTRVAEFRAGPDRRSIAPEPVRELLWVDQPEDNHNGGQLAFGPDGRLYLGLGDGGGAFDPERRAQDPASLLGKVVAVDADATEARWEVVVAGLRNPWRFSFDAALAELWVADVGQDEVEEVNRVRFEPEEVPKNLGWSAYEGDRRLPGPEPEGGGELVFPVATYGHDEGCSVTGGFVYGGTRHPELVRRYLYGDFCSGTLWTLAPTPDGGATDVRPEEAKVPQLTHIGEDGDGEIVFASAAGAIYRTVSPGEPGPGPS
ncbi:MAG TPA: PQQ-dependent sugar dehydrogenase [Acidimicrobiales bacterium]|jgi:glucose/arabinose dehydrogenase|nr:PQQ-dependent sugar dehydrogenase [Acidimicrobiales bacterium]